MAYAKGHFRSFIGKITTIPVFNPTTLGGYLDCTLPKLKTMVMGGEYINIASIMETVKSWRDYTFDDAISLNPDTNMVPMETSLNLNLTRTYDKAKAFSKENENEKSISVFELSRRQRRNNLFKNKIVYIRYSWHILMDKQHCLSETT